MLAPIGILIAVLLAAYGMLRPRMLDWGATPEERRAALPGDDLMPAATTVTTRAVTIGAPASAVWPWLVQMGQDRAGFYTHNWVERLLRSGIPDVHRMHPKWQQLEVGDLMRTNRDMGGKPMGWPVLAVDPGRSIVVQSKSLPVGTYALTSRLDVTAAGGTRLVTRMKQDCRWETSGLALLNFILMETGDFAMERRMLKGIKRRAESAEPSRRTARGRSRAPRPLN